LKVEIVAITSNQGQKHEQKCIEAGMKGFYNKPVSELNVSKAIA
jgi:CheY-like chemotaxis protein